MRLMLSLLQVAAFIFTTSSYAAFIPETYRAKNSDFYQPCRIAMRDWRQFQEHVRELLVNTMPKMVRDNIDLFLADDPESISHEATIGAFSGDFIELALGSAPLNNCLMRINKRIAKLFTTLKIPIEKRNADLMVSFLTLTILSINNPLIHSAFEALADQSNKGQITFKGEEAGMMEYFTVTLAVAGCDAANILRAWSNDQAKTFNLTTSKWPTLKGLTYWKKGRRS